MMAATSSREHKPRRVVNLVKGIRLGQRPRAKDSPVLPCKAIMTPV